MKRRKARENAFIALFEFSFGNDLQEVKEFAKIYAPEFAVDDFGDGLLKLYLDNATEIEKQIQSKLKGWTISRLPRVSTAILRLSVTELLYGQPDMDSVIINEAVELAKSYGDEGDYQFINGVLGSLSRGRESEIVAPTTDETPTIKEENPSVSEG